MSVDAFTWLGLLPATIARRPYVFALLAIFLTIAGRDLGARGTAGWLGWGFLVAFVAEYASTRVGVPFGLYHYTGETRGSEIFLSNVPFFDPLSFPFLAYASYCLARWALGRPDGWKVVALAGALMMLLDVVIDPLAVHGARWFLGHVFYYAEPGVYFGVPLANFAGWALVGVLIVGGYLLAAGRRGLPRASPAGGIALYYLVLCFNLAMTGWIGEWRLLGSGILVHVVVILILYRAHTVTTAHRHGAALRLGAKRVRPATVDEGGC